MQPRARDVKQRVPTLLIRSITHRLRLHQRLHQYRLSQWVLVARQRWPVLRLVLDRRRLVCLHVVLAVQRLYLEICQCLKALLTPWVASVVTLLVRFFVIFNQNHRSY